MKPHKIAERAVRNAIEALGFTVHDANILFDANCPNIDLVVFARKAALYIQVKMSTKPSGRNCVLADGSPWTKEQLFKGAPVFNRHADAPQAHLVVVAHKEADGSFTFYVAPPKSLVGLMLPLARSFANKPTEQGVRRKMFRKEIPSAKLTRYKNAWRHLGKPPKPLGHSEGGAPRQIV